MADELRDERGDYRHTRCIIVIARLILCCRLLTMLSLRPLITLFRHAAAMLFLADTHAAITLILRLTCFGSFDVAAALLRRHAPFFFIIDADILLICR